MEVLKDQNVCDPPILSIERGGILLEATKNDPREMEGILNPAVAGKYLLYRAVAKDNYSRLMAAELKESVDDKGNVHISAEKMDMVVLEPTKPYEFIENGKGGIEDPRVTPLKGDGYVMFYIGYGRDLLFNKRSPVVALAISDDGLHWERQGRIFFSIFDYNGYAINFNTIPNKDTVLFSEKINERYAIFFRPMFSHEQAKRLGVPWRAIWYADSKHLRGPWEHCRLVLSPMYEWEGGGIGSGVPPLHLDDAWLHIYHGFTKPKHGRHYNAGVFTTLHHSPTSVIYRSNCTVLEPVQSSEHVGTVPNVVFPTAAWPLSKAPNSLAIFWGAADSTIMWGLMNMSLTKTIPLVVPEHD